MNPSAWRQHRRQADNDRLDYTTPTDEDFSSRHHLWISRGSRLRPRRRFSQLCVARSQLTFVILISSRNCSCVTGRHGQLHSPALTSCPQLWRARSHPRNPVALKRCLYREDLLAQHAQRERPDYLLPRSPNRNRPDPSRVDSIPVTLVAAITVCVPSRRGTMAICFAVRSCAC